VGQALAVHHDVKAFTRDRWAIEHARDSRAWP